MARLKAYLPWRQTLIELKPISFPKVNQSIGVVMFAIKFTQLFTQ